MSKASVQPSVSGTQQSSLGEPPAGSDMSITICKYATVIVCSSRILAETRRSSIGFCCLQACRELTEEGLGSILPEEYIIVVFRYGMAQELLWRMSWALNVIGCNVLDITFPTLIVSQLSEGSAVKCKLNTCPNIVDARVPPSPPPPPPPLSYASSNPSI